MRMLYCEGNKAKQRKYDITHTRRPRPPDFKDPGTTHYTFILFFPA